jgi:hypothetical protein
MLFKELKQGYPLYVLNVNTLDVGTGTVTFVGQPHVTQDKQKLAKGQIQIVIDVTANFGNQSQTIELADSLSSTMSNDGSLLITPNHSDIANGMRMIRARCEEYIRNEDHYKELIKKCDAQLPNFDPLYKQSKESDARFSEMQNTIDKQSKDIAEMKEMISKLLKTK